MYLNVNKPIVKMLDEFLINSRVPNILFNGPSGTGKKKLVFNYLNKIYNNDTEIIKKYTMILNCAHDKGIKVIREDLKFFAKTNLPQIPINNERSIHFKTIILLNAEHLTIDAQSALRRCMELYSHTTRFFMLVYNKDKILKPILSRFCDIYIPYPIIKHKEVNLNINKSNSQLNINHFNELRKIEIEISFTDIINKEQLPKLKDLYKYAEHLYNEAYSIKELLEVLENNEYIKSKLTRKEILEKIIILNKLQIFTRNEKLLLYYSLYLFLISSNLKIENVFFN